MPKDAKGDELRSTPRKHNTQHNTQHTTTRDDRGLSTPINFHLQPLLTYVPLDYLHSFVAIVSLPFPSFFWILDVVLLVTRGLVRPEEAADKLRRAG
jgi:hypothetical protein